MERVEDPGTTRFFKNKAKSVNVRVKWVMLPWSESYFEETECIEVKNCSFSCNQEYF